MNSVTGWLPLSTSSQNRKCRLKQITFPGAITLINTVAHRNRSLVLTTMGQSMLPALRWNGQS